MIYSAPRILEMKFLGWLFIILCAQALSSLAFEISSTTRDRGFVLSKQHMQEQEANGVNRKAGSHGGSYGSSEVYIMTGQKGKGTYGGANIVHHPKPSEKNEAPLLMRTSLFFMLSTTILVFLFLLIPHGEIGHQW